MAFQSRPLNPSPIVTQIRRRPFLFFGLPFLTLTVLSSFALTAFTRTRYDLHASKHSQMTQEEELGMKKGRKRLDLREEYFRLSSGLDPSFSSSSSSSPLSSSSSSDPNSSNLDTSSSSTNLNSSSTSSSSPSSKPKRKEQRFISQDELENVRVPRLPGMPEWGGGAIVGGEEAPLKGHRKTDRWV
ncbi:cytochrome c oxidase assembly protein COX16-domain-containing protein [Naematelia encephala]|uniref:Cytochrome c oxidase assembly protein COX16, mitochondrial n=1 Tax=Naematelia encephala TaxID=71784 RepID=A0A1Y2AVI5_9TREE|nr:cytochrome c oxidase assembly protein COX16-domain-containing protein [Naematelia encephala]